MWIPFSTTLITSSSKQGNVSSLLGYIIAKDPLKMDPAKVSTVASWQVIQTQKQ